MTETPDDLLLSQEGYTLMGAAFEVHNILGGGLLEEIYQQSLGFELAFRQIPFQAKPELTVVYKGNTLDKKYVPDFVVFEKIIVEIKSVSAITTEHEAQIFNYMRISQMPVGYLINFGPIGKLQYKRFVISQRSQKKPPIENK